MASTFLAVAPSIWFAHACTLFNPSSAGFVSIRSQLESKQESVSAGKKVVAVHKKTGEQKVDGEARAALKIGSGAVKIKATQFPDWHVFIQT